MDESTKREKLKECIRRLTLMDDIFMSKIFENKSCAQLLLDIILERDDLIIEDIQTQYTLKNLRGHSVRLDIYARDAAGTHYNVEIQRGDKGAAARRARYYSSLMDADLFEPGEAYESLAETYVIFITENDVLGGRLPLYHINRTIDELAGRHFNDGAHIIYVNSKIQDETGLGRLMHDLYCADPKDMYYSTLAHQVSAFKSDEKGASAMSNFWEEALAEGRAEGRKEGRAEGRKEGHVEGVRKNQIETAERMLGRGKYSYEEIADCAGLTLAEVEMLANKPA